MGSGELQYIVDGENRIQWLSSEWSSPSNSNQSSSGSSELIGKSLFDFFSDDHIIAIYRQLFDRIRMHGFELHIPFRCDDAKTRRHMELRAKPEDKAGSIRITSRLIRQEKRPYVAFFDSEQSRSPRHVTACAWCKKVSLDDDWLEIEDAIHVGKLMQDDQPPQLSHGICEDCSDQFHLG